MASDISVATGKSGSAEVKGMTSFSTAAHRRLKARCFNRSKFTDELENMVVSVKRNIIAIIIVNQIAQDDLTNKIDLTEEENNKQ